MWLTVEMTTKEPGRAGAEPRQGGKFRRMAGTYQIDQAKHRIHTPRCIGAVTLDEVQQHFADLVRDPECPSGWTCCWT